MRSRFRRFRGGSAALAIVLGTAIGAPVIYNSVTGGGTPPPPPPGTASAWVDTSGGTCPPSTGPVSYVDAAACGNLQSALASLPLSGGTVGVQCGTYGAQSFTTTTHTGMATMQPVTPKCATLESTVSGTPTVSIGGAKWVTLKNFVINSASVGQSSFAVLDGSSTTSQSSNIVLDSNDINVGHVTSVAPNIYVRTGQNWLIHGNHVGPSIPLAHACSPNCGTSPEGIRVGKGSTAAPTCSTEACNITIDGNFFDHVVRDCNFWPASGYGLCPGVTCTNADGCHMDGVHVFGCITCSVTNNRLYGDECQGIFFEPTNNSLNQDITIVGNAVSSIAGGSGCGKGIYVNANGGAIENAGTFTIAFNSSPGIIDLQGFTGDKPGTVFNVYGNYGHLFLADTTGNAIACTTAPNANTTINWGYNAWTTNTPCGGTDRVSVSTPPWVNSAAAPVVGQDMSLTGALGQADDFVVCASVPIGCPSVDLAGTAYPAVADAGALLR